MVMLASADGAASGGVARAAAGVTRARAGCVFASLVRGDTDPAFVRRLTARTMMATAMRRPRAAGDESEAFHARQ
jgi:hypothetical protein